MKKGPLKFDHTIFLDRTHGKMMATLLRRVGIKVKSIYQCYPKKKHEKVKDPMWIELCGRKGWVAISGDKRLEKNIENLTAIIKHKVKVFILTDTNSLPEQWAAAVIVGQEKILNVIEKNDGPLFSTIQRCSRSHVSHARFPKIEEQEEEQQYGQAEAVAEAAAQNSTGDAAAAEEPGQQEEA